VSITDPSNATGAPVVAVVAGVAVVTGVAVAGEVVAVVAEVAGTEVAVVAVVAVVAIGAGSAASAADWACDAFAPAKRYTSPPVVAQLIASAPMRAPRAGWRRREVARAGVERAGDVSATAAAEPMLGGANGEEEGADCGRVVDARRCDRRSSRAASSGSTGGPPCAVVMATR
jgi:hypothetical protein